MSKCAAFGLHPLNCCCADDTAQLDQGCKAQQSVLQEMLSWTPQLLKGASHFLAEIVVGNEPLYERPCDLLKRINKPELATVLAKNQHSSMGNSNGMTLAQARSRFMGMSKPVLRNHLKEAWQAMVRQSSVFRDTLLQVQRLQLLCQAIHARPAFCHLEGWPCESSLWCSLTQAVALPFALLGCCRHYDLDHVPL